MAGSIAITILLDRSAGARAGMLGLEAVGSVGVRVEGPYLGGSGGYAQVSSCVCFLRLSLKLDLGVTGIKL